LHAAIEDGRRLDKLIGSFWDELLFQNTVLSKFRFESKKSVHPKKTSFHWSSDFFKKTTESFQKNVILENQKRTFSKYVTYSVKEQNNFKRTLFGKNNRTISKNITYSERTLESFQKNVIRRMGLAPDVLCRPTIVEAIKCKMLLATN